MRAVAVCCSVGRPELQELLAMWALQSMRLPLFVALDVDAQRWLPETPVRLDDGGFGDEWVAQRAPERVRRAAYPRSIGPLRAWAVGRAIELWGLAEDDVLVLLDDDDYYAPRHAELTLAHHAQWSGQRLVGARDFGIQWSPDAPGAICRPDLVCGGPYGPGPHATWALTLRLYLDAGGYQPDAVEDLALLSRLGWQRCHSHPHVTHVRRQYGGGSFSSESGERARLESPGPMQLLARLTPRVDALAAWCESQNA